MHDAHALHLPPDELNVHRMNASQTRIAVLQRLAALAAAVPRSVLEATKEHQNMGAFLFSCYIAMFFLTFFCVLATAATLIMSGCLAYNSS